MTQRNPLLWRFRAIRHETLKALRALPVDADGEVNRDDAKPLLNILTQCALALECEAPWPKRITPGQRWCDPGRRFRVLEHEGGGWYWIEFDRPYKSASVKRSFFNIENVRCWPEAWETEDPTLGKTMKEAK